MFLRAKKLKIKTTFILLITNQLFHKLQILYETRKKRNLNVVLTGIKLFKKSEDFKNLFAV